jgi:dTDP-glucose pyrophosphorylase
MKAIVLAAGKGVRMKPLTDDRPKVLLEVGGKPFLYHLMKNLQDAGFEDIGVVVGYKKEMIEEFLNDYDFKAELIHQKRQLGTGHALLQAKKFVNGDDFILVMGDNLYSKFDLETMRQAQGNCVASYRVEDPTRYGVLITDGDLLKGIVEKPRNPASNIINTGLYKFTSEIFDAVKKTKKSKRGEYELTDAIVKLAKQEKFKIFPLTDYWIDFGKMEDIKDVESFLLVRGFA